MAGLSPQGFQAKRLPEIITDIQTRLRESFGDNLNLRPESAITQLISAPALEIALAWEELERVFYSAFPRFAEGVSLDYCLQYTGNIRKPPQKERFYIRVASRMPSPLAISRGDQGEFPGRPDLGGFITLEAAEVTTPRDILCETNTNITLVDLSQNFDITLVNKPSSSYQASYQRTVERGFAKEPDDDLRARYLSQLSLRSTTTTQAIEAGILAIPGVDKVKVISNRGERPDSAGRPAGSIEIVVRGGASTDIASKIDELVAPGTTLVGSTVVVINSSQPVRFSRSIQVQIYLTFTLTIDPLVFTASDQLLTDSIAESAASLFSAGQPVTLSPGLQSIFTDFQGVIAVSVQGGRSKTDQTASTRNDTGIIPLSDLESPSFLPENITIIRQLLPERATPVAVSLFIRITVAANIGTTIRSDAIGALRFAVNSLAPGEDVYVFPLLTGSLQSLGPLKSVQILIGKRGQSIDGQFIEIAQTEKAILSEEDIDIEISIA